MISITAAIIDRVNGLTPTGDGNLQCFKLFLKGGVLMALPQQGTETRKDEIICRLPSLC